MPLMEPSMTKWFRAIALAWVMMGGVVAPSTAATAAEVTKAAQRHNYHDRHYYSGRYAYRPYYPYYYGRAYYYSPGPFFPFLPFIHGWEEPWLW
jgi:hypothetical protein